MMMKTLPEITAEVIDLAVRIQQIPAPTFSEYQRSQFIREQFLQRGLTDVTIDEIGDVFGRIKGTGSRPPIVFSAHLDTVFPAGVDLNVRRTSEMICGPGISDNSLGLAGLLGLIELLRPAGKLPGDVWLVANVCEEGLGNLKGMQEVVRRFGSGVLAYVVVEGTTLGNVYHRALGVQRFCIQAQTPGGHSWSSYGQPSAIHELAYLVTQLVQLPLPTEPRTTLNVGKFEGGTSVNTIAAEASLELDLRSESAKVLADLVERVLSLVRNANKEGDNFVRVWAEKIGERPAGEIPADHALIRLAAECLERQGITPNLGIGSTDANVPICQGLPAICIGLTTGSGPHTLKECMHIQPVIHGLQLLADLAEGVFQRL